MYGFKFYNMISTLLRITILTILFSFGSFNLGLSSEINLYPNQIVLYPNPATNYFKFKIELNTEVSQLTVFNIIGTKVKTVFEPQSDQEIDINDLPQGTYIVELRDYSNEVLSMQRLRKK